MTYNVLGATPNEERIIRSILDRVPVQEVISFVNVEARETKWQGGVGDDGAGSGSWHLWLQPRIFGDQQEACRIIAHEGGGHVWDYKWRSDHEGQRLGGIFTRRLLQEWSYINPDIWDGSSDELEGVAKILRVGILHPSLLWRASTVDFHTFVKLWQETTGDPRPVLPDWEPTRYYPYVDNTIVCPPEIYSPNLPQLAKTLVLEFGWDTMWIWRDAAWIGPITHGVASDPTHPLHHNMRLDTLRLRDEDWIWRRAAWRTEGALA